MEKKDQIQNRRNWTEQGSAFIELMLWLFVFSLFTASFWQLHQYYGRAYVQEIRTFQEKWNQLGGNEKRAKNNVHSLHSPF
jgi:hypothetical protein